VRIVLDDLHLGCQLRTQQAVNAAVLAPRWAAGQQNRHILGQHVALDQRMYDAGHDGGLLRNVVLDRDDHLVARHRGAPQRGKALRSGQRGAHGGHRIVDRTDGQPAEIGHQRTGIDIDLQQRPRSVAE
jgi:hypothetical protein